jgi:glucose/arabinose dehydrogenase
VIGGRLAAWGALAAAAVCAAAALAGAASPGTQATVTVRVDMRDFSFALSRRSVPAGTTVRFVVRNLGHEVHDFTIAGKKTRLLKRGQSQTLRITFRKKGRYPFSCRVTGHAHLGMKGTFSVGRPPAPPPPPSPPDVSGTIDLSSIGSFEQPVLVVAPPGDTDSIYVVEQTGAVRIVRSSRVLTEPFLDFRGRVTAMGESGLLSIAFAPDYATSGLLYAFYNSREGPYGDIRIVELRRHASNPDLVDPASERTLLTISKPYENHNGGMLQFGPDGYLYASVGDGDPGVLHPAGFFAQRLDDHLGNILRIDPRSGNPYAVPADNPFVGREGARPEVWAYGLRNPWRFWIDPETRTTIVADVGSTSREEVDVIVAGQSGLNFGWPCFEGTLVFDSTATCAQPVAPALEFPRDQNACAIIGGVVARDQRMPALTGRYLYGDLCSGKITVLTLEGRNVRASADLGVVVPALTSFGVDGRRQVYVTSGNGPVYRLDPKPAR